MSSALHFAVLLVFTSLFAAHGEPQESRRATQEKARLPDGRDLGRVQDARSARLSKQHDWMTYRDPRLHFQFEFPAAWGLTTGYHSSGHYHDSFASLNNAGKSNFWMFEYLGPKRDTSSPALQRGGVYVDIGQTTGPGGLTLDDQVNATDDLKTPDLRDILAKPFEESTHDGVRYRVIQFRKWRRFWSIFICTRDPISSADQERIQRFLTSFRFAEFPVGDPVWSVAQARPLLPRYTQVGPFPLLGSRGYNNVEHWRRGDDVVVRFTQANRYWESQSAWEFRVTSRGETLPLFESKPTSFQTSEWGPTRSGLQCRITLPTEIEQGWPLPVALRFLGLRDGLDPEHKVLNTFLLSQFVTLRLKNRANDKVVVVRPFGFSAASWPVDRGQGAFPLDNDNFGQDSDRVTFPLVTVRDVLAPGLYECALEFSFPSTPTPWWDKRKDWNGFRFWHGTIQSASVPLTVHAAKTNVWTVLCPKRLRLGVDGGLYFSEADAERKELPIGNGFFVGTVILDHKHDQKTIWPGTPAPYNIPVLARSEQTSGELLLSYTLGIFETAFPPRRPFVSGLGDDAFDPYQYFVDSGRWEEFDWAPQAPSADYRMLWTQEFTIDPAESLSLRQSPWKP